MCSSISAICAVVPVLLGPRGAGAVGRTYGVDAMRVYVVALVVRPRCPCWPPPRVLGTDAALALTCW